MASTPSYPPPAKDYVSFTPSGNTNAPATAPANAATQSSTAAQGGAQGGLGDARMAASTPAAPYGGTWLGTFHG
jgi:hypothetical protein